MQGALVGTVPSESRAGESYPIRKRADGVLTCECVAFERSRALPASCKHTIAWELAQLEPADALPIHTFTGRRVFPLRPFEADIAIEDIAHALSNQCRFAGHTRTFYSTAQHSVLVSLLCSEADALPGLLHDASEAYFVDVPKPLKHLPLLAGYRRAEAAMQARIFRRFGLRATLSDAVKAVDELIAAAEARELFAVVPAWALAVDVPPHIRVGDTWAPIEAEARFLQTWKDMRRGGHRQRSVSHGGQD